jgi:hypothetical protein
VTELRTDLRKVLKECLSKDLPPYVMREKLNEWDQESDEDRRELLAIARTVAKDSVVGKTDFEKSAKRMSEIVIKYM